MARQKEVRVGTSGWIYRHWRGPFYPAEMKPAEWFGYYCRFFDTVEINNSFYRLPPENAFREWRKQAPVGFLYAVKASRYLTHMKKLKDPEGPLENILGRARLLRPRLGPVLYQLPPRWHCNPDRLRDFLAALPRGIRHVLEFRDPSWYTDVVRELLTEAGISFCIHDLKGEASPLWVTGPVVYVRFHGPTQRAYAGRYRPKQLQQWAERIEKYRDQGRDVFAYFNNDDRAFAVTNARELLEMVGAAAPAGHDR